MMKSYSTLSTDWFCVKDLMNSNLRWICATRLIMGGIKLIAKAKTVKREDGGGIVPNATVDVVVVKSRRSPLTSRCR